MRTAAVLLRAAVEAARHLDAWEVIDYASAGKPDAPSGTSRELAERLGEHVGIQGGANVCVVVGAVGQSQHVVVAADTFGNIDDIPKEDGHVRATFRPRRTGCGAFGFISLAIP